MTKSSLRHRGRQGEHERGHRAARDTAPSALFASGSRAGRAQMGAVDEDSRSIAGIPGAGSDLLGVSEARRYLETSEDR